MNSFSLEHTSPADAWFSDRFGAPLPRALRDDASAMTWERFVATYGPPCGPTRLGHWACTDPQRPEGRIGPQARNFRATIAVGDHIRTSTAAASGPLAALTAMLHERGIAVETLRFHQMRSDEHTATFTTFIRGTDGSRDQWAMGWADDPTQSALRALIACANRLTA